MPHIRLSKSAYKVTTFFSIMQIFFRFYFFNPTFSHSVMNRYIRYTHFYNFVYVTLYREIRDHLNAQSEQNGCDQEAAICL